MADFEHSIFLLLLLVSVLNAKPPRPRLMLLIVLGGLLLAFLPPSTQVSVPWDAVLGLTIPVLLWQNGRRLIWAHWRRDWSEVGLWLLAAIGLGAVLWLDPNLSWTGAILFGLLGASMLWRTVESERESSHFGQLGPLTLVFLLAEVAPAVETPTRYVGGLFSGAAVGIAIAFMALRLARRAGPRGRAWIAVGQVYLSYWLAVAIDSSAVVAALLSVTVFLGSAVVDGLWDGGEIRPAPLNSWPGFGAVLLLLLLLGWQAHRPPSTALLLEVGLGLGIALAIARIGQWLRIAQFAEMAFWQVAVRTGMLLFPALSLWPRTTLLQPLGLAIALGVAALASVLAATTLFPLVNLQVSPEPDSAYQDDPAELLDQVIEDKWPRRTPED